MSDAATRSSFGTGPLSRAAALVYTLLVVEFMFLLTAAPGLVLLVLLERDASNIPLAAVCALPLGPALAAALYAMHHRSRDLTELSPASAFWRGYRANARGALQIWVPWLALLTIIGVNLANFAAAAVPGWWAVLLVLIAVAATLWTADALVITSLFAFRVRDVARLSVYFLVRAPGVTVGLACLLFLAAGVTVVTSEAVLMLLGSVFAAAVVVTCRPMVAEIRREFTR
jgi:uncharacterized membrane protein YesL